MATSTFVYMATSLDGYIAGPDGDISWLPQVSSDEVNEKFAQVLASSGCLIMGKNSYDTVCAFEGPWPYGDLPVLVVTHQSDPVRKVDSVHFASGTPTEVMALAKELCREGRSRIYIDGANVVSQMLENDLIDELILTIVPVLLGDGISLCPKTKRYKLSLVDTRIFKDDGLVQITYHVPKETSALIDKHT